MILFPRRNGIMLRGSHCFLAMISVFDLRQFRNLYFVVVLHRLFAHLYSQLDLLSLCCFLHSGKTIIFEVQNYEDSFFPSAI